MSKERNINIDVLRIIASILVITVHVISHKFESVSFKSYEWSVFNVFDSLARSCVPIFIMISGMFFLDNNKEIDIKKLYKKNIFKLVIIYIVWSIIYNMYFLFIKHSLKWSLYGIVLSIVRAPFHFWYIPMMINLYILVPILRKITNKCEEKYVKYIFIFTLISSLLFTIRSCTFLPYYRLISSFISKMYIDVLFSYYCYFLLGYFIMNSNFFDRHKKKFYVLGILSVIGCITGNLLVSYYRGKPFIEFYSYFSIFTFLESISIVLLFKNIKFNRLEKHKKNIFKISGLTLGIYIIHNMVINIIDDFFHFNTLSFNPILSVPIIISITFIISLVITFIIKKIKFIGKYIV